MVKARVVLARTLLPFCVGFGLAGETHAQQAAAPSAASDADIPAPTPSGTNGLLEKTPAQTPEPPQTVVPEPMPSRNQQPLRSANPEASASAAAIVPPPVQHRRFADWSTTRHQNPGQVVCFALGKPRSTALTARETEQPAAAESSLVYVTSWPLAGIKAEVSVLSGQPFRNGASAQLAIGAERFTLSTQGNRAFVDNPIQELKLLEAMKRGSQMILSGQTEDGVAKSDAFSLNGLAAALTHVTQGCP